MNLLPVLREMWRAEGDCRADACNGSQWLLPKLVVPWSVWKRHCGEEARREGSVCRTVGHRQEGRHCPILLPSHT